MLAFAGAAVAQEQPGTFKVPFGTVKGMFLLDAVVDGKPVVLQLDTGANRTVVSAKLFGYPGRLAPLAPSNGGVRSDGDAVERSADIVIGQNRWIRQPIFVMNMDAVSKRLGTEVDGLFGQELMRAFSSIRIDRKNRIIELEE